VQIVDGITLPTGQMLSVELLNYQVPQEFVAYFLIKDETPLNKEGLNWSVELRIQIGELGTPILQSLTHRGLTGQEEITIDGLGNYVPTRKHSGVSRKQIAIVEKNLGELLDACLSLMLKSAEASENGGFTILSKTRNIREKELQRFRKEMRNRFAKTKLTPEFLKEVAELYLAEVSRSKKAGDRCRTTEVICEAFRFRSDKKTVEAWVAKARREGFLPESNKKRVSATTAGSKSKSKVRKERK
jgi:hypothetical protein